MSKKCLIFQQAELLQSRLLCLLDLTCLLCLWWNNTEKWCNMNYIQLLFKLTMHLKVAQNMETESFILALRRFIAHQGNIRMIRWDNGWNLVVWKSKLQRTISKMDQEKISLFLQNNGTDWLGHMGEQSSFMRSHGKSLLVADKITMWGNNSISEATWCKFEGQIINHSNDRNWKCKFKTFDCGKLQWYWKCEIHQKGFMA